jgi:hypothetical protein
MTTTLATLTTRVRRDLRDPASETFSDAEIQDLIGQGIDEIGGFYPQEFVEPIAIIAGTYSYALPDGMDGVFRVDVYNDDGTFRCVLPEAEGAGINGGYQIHAGIMFLPQWGTWTADMSVEVWGYGPWAYIDSSSGSAATTDLPLSGRAALFVFCQVEAFHRLAVDRAKFLQWQATPGNTDVSAIGLASIAREQERRWTAQAARLRKLRRNN